MIKSLVLSLAAGLFLMGCSNSHHHEGMNGHEQHMQADEPSKPSENRGQSPI